MKIKLLVLITFKLSLVIASEQSVLINCQAIGHALYINCVKPLSLEPKQLAICTALKVDYIICLKTLNQLMQLEIANFDPYFSNPFSPCQFTIGSMILWDVCPN